MDIIVVALSSGSPLCNLRRGGGRWGEVGTWYITEPELHRVNLASSSTYVVLTCWLSYADFTLFAYK